MKAIELIKRQEGFRSKPYHDTKGILTIGYGLNLEEGITEKEASLLLEMRIEIYTNECYQLISNFNELNTIRQAVLVDMLYNLGKSRLSGFKKMIIAIKLHDFKEAAIEMLDSKWAKQVKGRAITLAKMMEKGTIWLYHIEIW